MTYDEGVDISTSVWIFGFGSLVHSPGFEYARKVEGYILGWKRVFYQGSTDHRGVPEAPGRTVTLMECPEAVTWGVAFLLAGNREEQQRTLQYLEWREKQYDLRVQVDVYSRHDPCVPAVRGALVYVATSNKANNPNYLGPAPEDAIAHQIATSRGPSGPNYEYLFRLAQALREMSVEDEELFRLEEKVRQRMEELQIRAEEVLGIPHSHQQYPQHELGKGWQQAGAGSGKLRQGLEGAAKEEGGRQQAGAMGAGGGKLRQGLEGAADEEEGGGGMISTGVCRQPQAANDISVQGAT